MTPCACPYETASLQVAEGELRGVLVCAVCNRPKARRDADTILDESGAMAALRFGPTERRTFRELVNKGRIPALRFSPRVLRFHLPTIIARYQPKPRP